MAAMLKWLNDSPEFKGKWNSTNQLEHGKAFFNLLKTKKLLEVANKTLKAMTLFHHDELKTAVVIDNFHHWGVLMSTKFGKLLTQEDWTIIFLTGLLLMVPTTSSQREGIPFSLRPLPFFFARHVMSISIKD